MGKGLSSAGFACALLGLIFSFVGMFVWFLALLALPLAIAGLILSVIGGKKIKAAGESFGLATAGLVIGIIATVFSGITFFTCGVCGLCLACEIAKGGQAANDLINSLT